MTETMQANELAFLQNAENLPSLPAVALQVLKRMREPEVALETIGSTLGKDPSLSARLLKLSNSSLFGYSREVSSLQQALMILGLKTVKLATISFSLVPALGAGKTSGIDAKFWRRAVIAAVTGRKVCERFNAHLVEEASLVGLLMDVGIPVLAKACGAPYQSMLEASEIGHPSSETAEREISAVSHSRVAEIVLEAWELPELLVKPVAHHHTPDELHGRGDAWTLARVAAFSHEVAVLFSSESQASESLSNAIRMGEEWFRFSEQDTKDLIHELDAHVDQMASLMEVDIGGSADAALILQQAQEDLLSLTVGATMALDSKVKELECRASTDALTGAPNRGAFDQALARRWKQLSEHEIGSLGLLMIDIDKFKNLNDTYGHQAGDDVLKAVAANLGGNCRGSDTVYRYGGEEFVVVVLNPTLRQLERIAERLRAGLAALEVQTSMAGILRVTASFGGNFVTEAALPAAAALKVADRNLYKAKESGRNRCVVT